MEETDFAEDLDFGCGPTKIIPINSFKILIDCPLHRCWEYSDRQVRYGALPQRKRTPTHQEKGKQMDETLSVDSVA